MKLFAERIYAAMDNQLNEITVNGGSQTEQLKESIKVCKKAMAKLKNYISSYAFQSQEEEIEFFKEIKPRFYSKYIYFINVYNFLTHLPLGGATVVREYIQQQLADLKRFFDHNHSFFQYYRAGDGNMDQRYFSRGGFDVHIELEDFEEDELYSTSHDYKLSKIIANEKFQEYLNLELLRLDNDGHLPIEPVIEAELTWTFTKTDLIELIYALVALGVFNHGSAEIKTVVKVFETVFHADLRHYYHKYTDITRRKKDRTAFLDKLKLALLRKIDMKMDEDGDIQQSLKFG